MNKLKCFVVWVMLTIAPVFILQTPGIAGEYHIPVYLFIDGDEADHSEQKYWDDNNLELGLCFTDGGNIGFFTLYDDDFYVGVATQKQGYILQKDLVMTMGYLTERRTSSDGLFKAPHPTKVGKFSDLSFIMKTSGYASSKEDFLRSALFSEGLFNFKNASVLILFIELQNFSKTKSCTFMMFEQDVKAFVRGLRSLT